MEWRRSSGPELLPIALRGAIRSRRKSTDTRPAGFLGAQQGEEPLHISRWLATAVTMPSIPVRCPSHLPSKLPVGVRHWAGW